MGEGTGGMMVAPAPSSKLAVFRSVDRPELVLGQDDVSLCHACGDLSTAANEAATREYGPCAICRDYRIVSGYGPGGYGLPVVLEDSAA